MSPLLSSIAPAYSWAGLTAPQDLQDPVARLGVIRAAWPAIDLRDLLGGGPWPLHGQELDDAVAGRVLAEMIRQLGPDGQGVFPSLLGPWEAWGSAGVKAGYKRYMRRCLAGPCAGLVCDVKRTTSTTARWTLLTQADQARPCGAILWEQVA